MDLNANRNVRVDVILPATTMEPVTVAPLPVATARAPKIILVMPVVPNVFAMQWVNATKEHLGTGRARAH